MIFGNRLAKLRRARGLSMKQLSHQTGANLDTLYTWEGKGVKNPAFASVVKLSEALRVPLSAFAYDETCERCVELIEEGKL